MSISDTIYRPFESLIRPLDIPYQPLPSRGPIAVLLHFISVFRGVLIAVTVCTVGNEAMSLTIVWDRDEVASALVDVADAHMLTMIENDKIDLFLGCLRKRP